MEYEPTIRYHGANLEASNLFPSYPPKEIHFLKPAMQHLHNQLRLIPHHNGIMKSIIPQERPWKNQPRRGESKAVIMLMRHYRILGVEFTLVVG